jgi:outer membrane protein
MTTITTLRRAALTLAAVGLAAAPAMAGGSPADAPADGDAAAATTGAETSAPPLTLREAVERALATYPAVAAARADRAAAGHDLGEAEAARRPTVEASAAGTYHDLPALATPIHGFDFANLPEFDRAIFQGAVTVDYLVADGGARAGRIRQREAQAAAAAAALGGAEQATAAKTAAAYLDALTGEETLDAHRRRIAALAAERDRVVQRFEAGRAAEVEVRRVDAELAGARAERVAIEAALETARADLARLIGGGDAGGAGPALGGAGAAGSLDPGAALAGRLQPVALADRALASREELAAAALAGSPEVEEVARALAAAEASVAVARARDRPTLHAVGNGLEFGAGGGTFQTEWNAGLRLAVPLYTGGADRERVARAAAARDAAAERLRLARLAVGERVDRALAAVREAGARVEALAEAAAAFAEVARIERLRLDAGVGTQTDYLAAEADLLASRARLVAARHGEIAARVELARAAGGLDLAWFDRALVPLSAPTAEETPP